MPLVSIDVSHGDFTGNGRTGLLQVIKENVGERMAAGHRRGID